MSAPRNLLVLAIGMTLGGAAVVVHGAPVQQPAPAAGVQVQVDQGKQIFATSCSNCHGAGGKGAIGPPLIDRNLSFSVLSTTILNGRVGTPMPPFKDGLDSRSLAAVMAYVQSITSGGRLPTEIVADPTESGSSPSLPSAQPVAVGRDDTGIAARGASLFFDPTRMEACRACHSFAEKGGPIGPDLSLKPKSPEQIYQSISRAKVVSADYPALALHMMGAPDLVGIKAEETSSAYVIFDVTAIPPIKRTLLKSQVTLAVAVAGAGIFDHTKLPYSKQDRLDLAAYLGKTQRQSPQK